MRFWAAVMSLGGSFLKNCLLNTSTRLWADVAVWWHLRHTSRCARCPYQAPRRIRARDSVFVVDCMGCDVEGLSGETMAKAVWSWNTDNRRAP